MTGKIRELEERIKRRDYEREKLKKQIMEMEVKLNSFHRERQTARIGGQFKRSRSPSTSPKYYVQKFKPHTSATYRYRSRY